MRIIAKKLIYRFPDSEEGQIEDIILSDLAAVTTDALELREVTYGIVEAIARVRRKGYQDIQIDLMYGPAPLTSQDYNVPWLRVVAFIDTSDFFRELNEVPLEILALPTRIQNTLLRVGFQSVGDILMQPPKSLLQVRDIGAKSLETIREQMLCIVSEDLARSDPRPLPEPGLLIHLLEEKGKNETG